MGNDITTDESQHTFRYFSWKIILGFMALPILMDVILLLIILSHFSTYNGSPIAEISANILLHVGNWPSLLLKMYPYELNYRPYGAADGKGCDNCWFKQTSEYCYLMYGPIADTGICDWYKVPIGFEEPDEEGVLEIIKSLLGVRDD